MTTGHSVRAVARVRPIPTPLIRALFVMAPLAVIFAAMLGAGEARGQDCAASQTQLTQAITDSQHALQREQAALNSFDQAISGPRTTAVDTQPVVAARASIDSFVTALVDFRNKVGPLQQACGSAFANDLATLDSLIQQFTEQRDRADQLLAANQALNDSGEPALTQQQIEAVQRTLVAQGYSRVAVDGQLGTGTREAIRAWQGASGYPVTGFLTEAQLQQLTSPPSGQVGGLPPAPWSNGAPQAPTDAQGQQVCADNTAQVDVAVQRTQQFREQAATRRDALRGGTNVSAVSGLQSEIDEYLRQVQDFQSQAQGITGRCGAGYDQSLAALGREVEALRSLGSEVQGLITAAEPTLTTEQRRTIQQGLAARGHYTGAIDAVFGAGTRNAIRAYQTAIGAAATGYLTAGQVQELQRAAAVQPVEPIETVEPVPAVEEPETIATAPEVIEIEDVRERLEDELRQAEIREPFSGVEADDGSFGELYARAQEDLAEDRPQRVADQRFALLGAAYMEESADSLEMVDAHALIADAYIALGLYADAAQHLQRAYAVWQKVDEGEPAQSVWLQERLATVRLAQELVDDDGDPAELETIGQLLANAREVAERELGDDDPLSLRLVDRQADIAAALGTDPDDDEVAAALAARYGG